MSVAAMVTAKPKELIIQISVIHGERMASVPFSLNK